MIFTSLICVSCGLVAGGLLHGLGVKNAFFCGAAVALALVVITLAAGLVFGGRWP